MELFKKILSIVIAVIVIYFVLMITLSILNNSISSKITGSKSGSIKIISAPITKTLPSSEIEDTGGTVRNSGVCTADAFVCPSGVTVGRTGPNCQFVCPNINR